MYSRLFLDLVGRQGAEPSVFNRAAHRASRITRTPFPGSAKIYIEGSRPDIRVPFRVVTLTDTLVTLANASAANRKPLPVAELMSSNGMLLAVPRRTRIWLGR